MVTSRYIFQVVLVNWGRHVLPMTCVLIHTQPANRVSASAPLDSIIKMDSAVSIHTISMDSSINIYN